MPGGKLPLEAFEFGSQNVEQDFNMDRFKRLGLSQLFFQSTNHAGNIVVMRIIVKRNL